MNWQHWQAKLQQVLDGLREWAASLTVDTELDAVQMLTLFMLIVSFLSLRSWRRKSEMDAARADKAEADKTPETMKALCSAGNEIEDIDTKILALEIWGTKPVPMLDSWGVSTGEYRDNPDAGWVRKEGRKLAECTLYRAILDGLELAKGVAANPYPPDIGTPDRPSSSPSRSTSTPTSESTDSTSESSSESTGTEDHEAEDSAFMEKQAEEIQWLKDRLFKLNQERDPDAPAPDFEAEAEEIYRRTWSLSARTFGTGNSSLDGALLAAVRRGYELGTAARPLRGDPEALARDCYNSAHAHQPGVDWGSPKNGGQKLFQSGMRDWFKSNTQPANPPEPLDLPAQAKDAAQALWTDEGRGEGEGEKPGPTGWVRFAERIILAALNKAAASGSEYTGVLVRQEKFIEVCNERDEWRALADLRQDGSHDGSTAKEWNDAYTDECAQRAQENADKLEAQAERDVAVKAKKKLEATEEECFEICREHFVSIGASVSAKYCVKEHRCPKGLVNRVKTLRSQAEVDIQKLKEAVTAKAEAERDELKATAKTELLDGRTIKQWAESAASNGEKADRLAKCEFFEGSTAREWHLAYQSEYTDRKAAEAEAKKANQQFGATYSHAFVRELEGRTDKAEAELEAHKSSHEAQYRMVRLEAYEGEVEKRKAAEKRVEEFEGGWCGENPVDIRKALQDLVVGHFPDGVKNYATLIGMTSERLAVHAEQAEEIERLKKTTCGRAVVMGENGQIAELANCADTIKGQAATIKARDERIAFLNGHYKNYLAGIDAINRAAKEGGLDVPFIKPGDLSLAVVALEQSAERIAELEENYRLRDLRAIEYSNKVGELGYSLRSATKERDTLKAQLAEAQAKLEPKRETDKPKKEVREDGLWWARPTERESALKLYGPDYRVMKFTADAEECQLQDVLTGRAWFLEGWDFGDKVEDPNV